MMQETNSSNPFGKIIRILRLVIDIIVNILNSILLSLVYIFGIGITAVAAKIFRKKFLETRKANKNVKTYWKNISREKEEHLRTF